MVKYIPLFLLFVFVAPPVGATAQLDRQTCASLMVAHMPDGDVAYRAGTDVAGKPVVEADLNPPVIKPPETVTFDITVDVAAYAGIAVPAGVENKAKIGTIAVLPDGRMTFNGEPVENKAAAMLRDLCKKRPLQKRRRNIYNP